MTKEERELLILIASYAQKDIRDTMIKAHGEPIGAGNGYINKIQELIDAIKRQAGSE